MSGGSKKKSGLGWRAVDSKADLLKEKLLVRQSTIILLIVLEVITMRQARLQLLSLGLLMM